MKLSGYKPGYYAIQKHYAAPARVVAGPFVDPRQAARVCDTTEMNNGWIDTARVTLKGKVKPIARTKFNHRGEVFAVVTLCEKELERAHAVVDDLKKALREEEPDYVDVRLPIWWVEFIAQQGARLGSTMIEPHQDYDAVTACFTRALKEREQS